MAKGDDNGWQASAEAWIADMRNGGDFGRCAVLDAPMQAIVRELKPRTAVDIGCGEGRFSRWMQGQGIAVIGVEPTPALCAHARAADPDGEYREEMAEALSLADASVDLAVFFLTLIDIDDYAAAIAEAARVLRPGGHMLVANLQAYNTAAVEYDKRPDGSRQMVMDDYLEEKDGWFEWRGIRIRNWHRPLSAYMGAFLEQGLRLVRFEEPRAHGGSEAEIRRYNKAPHFLVMVWQKPWDR